MWLPSAGILPCACTVPSHFIACHQQNTHGARRVKTLRSSFLSLDFECKHIWMQTHSFCFLVLVRMALNLTWLCCQINCGPFALLKTSGKYPSSLSRLSLTLQDCIIKSAREKQRAMWLQDLDSRGYDIKLGIRKLLFFQTICCKKTNWNHSPSPTRLQTDIFLFFGLLLSPGLSCSCQLCSPERKLIQKSGQNFPLHIPRDLRL